MHCRHFSRALAVLLALAAFGCASSRGPGASPVDPAAAAESVALDEGTLEGFSPPIHYVRAGSSTGPCVIFIHGSPGSWRAFGHFLRDPELAARARLIAFDRPGYGLSGRGQAEPSLERQAAVVGRLLELEPAERPVILVGHSLGGPIATEAAVDFPARISALLLIAPSIDPDHERLRWFNRLARTRLAIALLPLDFITSNREILPLHGELVKLKARLEELATRVVLIQGRRDHLVSPANADFAERTFTHAQLKVERLAKAGHLIPFTQPEVVKQALEALLDELGR
ncbi:MAG: alpha/beta fold hydrolase [Thermoanaerobaculia bacterium]